mmetsp:Transcript_18359/g.20407  ORF Transcript_18359/g.20407 Transcript_18359/m.20407 type:complete len:218 (+) Transcript_18359:129-782(+)|eukprot:CAMPEP_0168529418 /NCGR_PEP_ID=MMETSP0405-20121227/13903_1 /TAXON_ID=498012 /ORGANISM="Trichosphaerium sp, Strain Am-I-7 wt" /LENGTH=217 /DNA_ID=CAMNT_0008553151 /DNA_START=96 /DNA_END=749 /DNA_ORIENTATION=-
MAVTAADNVDEQTKHPLENEWTFWYDKRQQRNRRAPGEKQNYEANLKTVGIFGAVEDFWRYWNNVAAPSQLIPGSNYHIFKTGIKPMWEDTHNKEGGKWVINLKSHNREMLDTLWQEVVLGLVGETLDPTNEICGAVCSIRKNADRIAVWNRRATDDSYIDELGEHLVRVIKAAGPPTNKVVMQYQVHSDALKSGTSYENPEKYNKTINGVNHRGKR